jgi:hypothetical protein
MGQIYSQAQLYIIVTAGSNPKYGLPAFGDLKLVEGYYSADSLRNSHWACRGWTFQEACLARRRLIFTDQQVIFSCYEMCCQESLNSDEWEETNAESTNGIGGPLSRLIPDIWEGKTPIAGILLQALLEGYSQRQLSYDADMINAIQGVFSTLDVRHCWGMPFECLAGGTEMTLALNWHGSEGGGETGFPSWSWASKKMQWKEFSKPSMSSKSLRVEVALANEAWLDADAYFRSYAIDNDHNLGRLIRVTGHVSCPSFLEYAWFHKRAPSSSDLCYSKLYAVLKRWDLGYWIYRWRTWKKICASRSVMATLM